MLRNSHYAPGFDASHPETNPAGWSARPTAAASWPIATTLRAIRDAWREGLAAHRQYEHLRASGTPHDAAVRAALGIGLIPSRVTHEAAKPLYFAGKA